MRTPEEILTDKGLLLSTFYSSSIYDAILQAMKEYASQFYSEQQVRESIRLARNSEEKIIELVKSSEQPMTFMRVNTNNSICFYCGYKIGKLMKCPGCGQIDPPVIEAEQPIK